MLLVATTPSSTSNGEVTDGTHVAAGPLTPYAQVTDLAVNTAASGNNAAAIQSLDDRVTAKLDSSALAPAIAPLATAAALATTDGQVAAHGSSIAALQSLLTTGLSNKADQSRTSGMLPVTGPSNMFTYVLADALVQWLWDIRGAGWYDCVSPRATSTRSGAVTYKIGHWSVSALLHSRTLTEFSGQSGRRVRECVSGDKAVTSQ